MKCCSCKTGDCRIVVGLCLVPITSGEQYKSWTPFLCCFLYHPISLFVFDPTVLLNISPLTRGTLKGRRTDFKLPSPRDCLNSAWNRVQSKGNHARTSLQTLTAWSCLEKYLIVVYSDKCTKYWLGCPGELLEFRC